MKKLLRKAVTAFRWAVVFLCLMALTVGGASSAQRLFEAYETPQEAAAKAPEVAQLQPGPPTPDQVPENMTPSGKPNCEPSAYLSAPILLDSNNNQSRTPSKETDCPVGTMGPLHVEGKSSIRATAFEVSSHLGLQFTLVGAKPSGTS